MTLQRRNPRRRARWLALLATLAMSMVVAPVSPVSADLSLDGGFEGADGNLTPPTTTPPIDWNTFDPTSWLGTAPYRESSKTTAGWKFVGLEDAQVSGSDTVFAGGTKQDDSCARVGSGPKPPNKDDLKRAYIASALGTDGHTYLALAWARIPQNTTSASAHVGFEFNQADPDLAANLCGGSSGDLVERSVDDVLIVYDFEGGSSDPVLRLLRWRESGACDAGGAATADDPCWVAIANLSADGDADGAVNVGVSVSDTIAPSDETLNDSEFGEAVIDLTDAGVFPQGTCVTFGSVFAVSRSSGNSQQAAMKDLVGPGDPGLTNCGEITIIKRSSPRGVNQPFGFTSNITGSQLNCTADPTPAGFSLNDRSVAISANTAANPSVVTTAEAHGYASGQTVTISGSNSTPSLNGNRVITVLTATTFSVPVNVTTAGTAGTVVGDSTRNTEKCVNVPTGSYTVTEGNDPAGFVFNNFSCTSSGGASATPSSSTTVKATTISMTGGGSVTCVFTNDQLISSGTTQQRVYPNDQATFTSTGGTLEGDVTFTLYSNLTCTAGTGDANVLFTQTIQDIQTNGTGSATSRTVVTTNYPGGVTTPYVVTSVGTNNLSWRATFASDNAILGSQAPCESVVITIDNDITSG